MSSRDPCGRQSDAGVADEVALQVSACFILDRLHELVHWRRRCGNLEYGVTPGRSRRVNVDHDIDAAVE
jgi:hypothetical protein